MFLIINVIFTERLDEHYRSLQTKLHQHQTKLQVIEQGYQDESQRLWDNINELQEMTNITTRNIEDIYDKDILRLQNFQNLFEGDLNRLKNEIAGAIGTEAVGLSNTPNFDSSDLEEKVETMYSDLKKAVRSSSRIQNLTQNFRSEMNIAFKDIDELKITKFSELL